MIKVEVDESHAFDMLSILDIKLNNSILQEYKVIERERDRLWDSICDQISIDKAEEISFSKEYDDLTGANTMIFKVLNEIKSNRSIRAYIIDDLNYQRFLRKKALQDKFFGVGSTSEQKLGYE